MLPEGDIKVQRGLCQAPVFLFVMAVGSEAGRRLVLFLLCNLAILPPSGWLLNRSCKRSENAIFLFSEIFLKNAKVHFTSNTQTALDSMKRRQVDEG